MTTAAESIEAEMEETPYDDFDIKWVSLFEEIAPGLGHTIGEAMAEVERGQQALVSLFEEIALDLEEMRAHPDHSGDQLCRAAGEILHTIGEAMAEVERAKRGNA